MSTKRRKDKELEEIHLYNFQTSYKLLLTPEDTFRAEWEGNRIASGDTAQACKNEAYKYLEEATALIWIPAIKIEIPDKMTFHNPDTFLALSFVRLYVARRKNDRAWVFEKWNSDPQYRRATDTIQFYRTRYIDGRRLPNEPGPIPDALPFYIEGSEDDPGPVYISYSEEKYALLQDVANRIQALKRRLKGLMLEDDLASLFNALNPVPTLSSNAPPLLALPAVIVSGKPKETKIEGNQEAAPTEKRVVRMAFRLDDETEAEIQTHLKERYSFLNRCKRIRDLTPDETEELDALEAAKITPEDVQVKEHYCPALRDPAATDEESQKHHNAPPCCDKAGTYNGFGSGELLFVCPNHCPCHD